METFCGITMQLPLFQLKLKTFPLLTAAITLLSRVSFLSRLPLVITVSQIAPCI